MNLIVQVRTTQVSRYLSMLSVREVGKNKLDLKISWSFYSHEYYAP